MKRDYKLFLNDIKESMNILKRYVAGVSEEQFLNTLDIQDKVIRRLEIIGEASSNIPRAIKDANKHIPWFEMINFRNFVVHHYYEASLSRIWNIVTIRLPIIQKAMQNIKLL